MEDVTYTSITILPKLDVESRNERRTRAGNRNDGHNREAKRGVPHRSSSHVWLYGGAALLGLLMLGVITFLVLRVVFCTHGNVEQLPAQNSSVNEEISHEMTKPERECPEMDWKIQDSLNPSQTVWCREEERPPQSGGYLFCPAGWHCLRDTCYFISPGEKRTWSNSKAFCVNHGGKLIHRAEDMDIVDQLRQTNILLNSDSYWIGLSSLGFKNWLWEDSRKYHIHIKELLPNSDCASLDDRVVRAWPCSTQKKWICNRRAQEAKILQI